MKILTAYADWSHTPKRKELNAYGGIGYYRQIKPWGEVKGHDIKIVGKELTTYGDSLESQWDNIFKEFDVFSTSYFSDDRSGAAIFYHAKKHGKKVIIDIDDNYLDVSPGNPVYDKFKPQKRDRAILSTILSFADALTVSTEPLKERIFNHIKQVHGIEKPIFIVPNFNDVRDWDFKPVAKDPNRFVIGYSGSASHKEDLEMILPAIREIMAKHKHVWFEILGILAIKDLKNMLGGFTDDMLGRIATVGATNTFREYPSWLAERPWNVGIAPLVDSAFTRSKSHIKWMEYSMYEIPTIASRVYPYFMDVAGRDTIRDGETGILVGSKGWKYAIDDMIVDYDKLKVVGKNAKEQIVKEWQYKDSGLNQVFNDALDSLSK